MYLRTGSQNPVHSMAADFCTTKMPLLNPLLFILKNQEMKADLTRLSGGRGLGQSQWVFSLHMRHLCTEEEEGGSCES